VVDASLTLQWFLEDEIGRQYSLDVLASLATKRAAVPMVWFYEVGNGLLMAHRRKRIKFDQVEGYLVRLQKLPIDAPPQSPAEVLQLPSVAQKYGLTNYDAAYLALAMRLGVPLATSDADLQRAAAAAGVAIVTNP